MAKGAAAPRLSRRYRSEQHPRIESEIFQKFVKLSFYTTKASRSPRHWPCLLLHIEIDCSYAETLQRDTGSQLPTVLLEPSFPTYRTVVLIAEFLELRLGLIVDLRVLLRLRASPQLHLLLFVVGFALDFAPLLQPVPIVSAVVPIHQ